MTERVLIVDDHPLTRDALSALLAQQGFDVVGEAEDGASAIAEAAALRPDIVLLDLTMPGMDGLTALPKIREQAPESEVVVLTASDAEENLLAAIRAGASGYLLKTEPPEQIAAFLRGVARGDAALSGGVARRLLDRVRDGGRLSGVPEEITRVLSAREVEVLLLLDEHLGTDEIAQRLFISEHTVRSHVKSLLKKLGVSSRREALERLDVARGGLALAREPFERSLDEPGQRLEVVSALEDCGDTRRKRRAPARELAKPVRGHRHLGQRIVAMGVEAGRDEHELGLEGTHDRLDDLVECRVVGGITRTGGERDVHDSLGVRIRPSRPWPERPLVKRDREHARVVAEQRLGAIAVMDVEVDDGDALETERVLRVTGGDRDVAEDAEAHRLRLERMVARRSYEREAPDLHGSDRTACGQKRRFARGRHSVRVRIEPHLGVDALDRSDVARRVDTADLLPRRGRSVHVSREMRRAARAVDRRARGSVRCRTDGAR